MPNVSELSVLPVLTTAPALTDYLVCQVQTVKGEPQSALVPISLVSTGSSLRNNITPITGGAANQLLYDKGGTLGELGIGPGLEIVGGLLVSTGGGRTVLTGNTNFYVATTGNDSNPGTLAQPWATVQHAVNFIYTNIDAAGFTVTANVATGSYGGASVFYPLNATQFTIAGVSGTPSAVSIDDTVTGFSCLDIQTATSGLFNVSNLTLKVTAANGYAMTNETVGISVGLVDIAITSTNVAGSRALFGFFEPYCVVQPSTALSISGNWTNGWEFDASNCQVLGSVPLTLTGTPAFSTAYINFTSPGCAYNLAGSISGASTGVQYILSSNSSIGTFNGSNAILAGNQAGTNTLGSFITSSVSTFYSRGGSDGTKAILSGVPFTSLAAYTQTFISTNVFPVIQAIAQPAMLGINSGTIMGITETTATSGFVQGGIYGVGVSNSGGGANSSLVRGGDFDAINASATNAAGHLSAITAYAENANGGTATELSCLYTIDPASNSGKTTNIYHIHISGANTSQATGENAGLKIDNQAFGYAIKTGAGPVSFGDALIDNRVNYQQPTTGFTITLNNFDWFVILDPSGTLATGTVKMPAAPTDGQIINIRTSQVITSLTINGNGAAVAGYSTGTLALGGILEAIYKASNTTWYF